MSTYFKSSAGKAAIILAALGFGAASIGATPLPARPADPTQGVSDNLVLVKHKKGHNAKQKKRWRYSDKRHGKRYRYKRSGYGYNYGGWWYPRPYWRSEPGIIIQLNL